SQDAKLELRGRAFYMPSALPAGEFTALLSRILPKLESAFFKDQLLCLYAQSCAGAEASALLRARWKELTMSEVKVIVINRFAAELDDEASPILGAACGDPQPTVRAAAEAGLTAMRRRRDNAAAFEAWEAADRDARTTIA